jgi:hypothetical protein
MRTVILASAIILGMASGANSIPVAPQATVSNAILVHGCHRYYAHDLSGWHRHDYGCNPFRGLIPDKSRSPAKS